MTNEIDLLTWLRTACSEYSFDLLGVFQAHGDHPWPVTARNAAELQAIVSEGGHLLPLPKESAALANVLEVGISDYLAGVGASIAGLDIQRGTERGYPDLEFTGAALRGQFHAVDIKVARRKRIKSGVSKNTESRITLYTGNSYFMYPTLHWPGTFRPFADYTTHLDIIVLYTLDDQAASRVRDLELIVQPSWRIASKQRSSTTREYIGAVVDIEDLRAGNGEFASAADFYTFWRKYPFKIGGAVKQQLNKLLGNK